MKKIKLFPKIFILLTMAMLLITILTMVILGLAMPKFYENYKINNINNSLSNLTDELANCGKSEFRSKVYKFQSNNNAYIWIYEENGTLYIYDKKYGDSVFEDDAGFYEDTLDGKIEEANDGYRFYELTKTFTNDGTKYYAYTYVTLQPINEATKVIYKLMPYVTVILVLISLVLSYFISGRIIKPITNLSKKAIKMQNFEDVSSNSDIEDEIGLLGNNMDKMYHNLLDMIDKLEADNKKIQEAEEEKLQFMRAASHELKTPIAASKAMVEGMSDGVGKYKDHDYYLREVNKELDKLSQMVKDLLNNSNFNVSSIRVESFDVNILLKEILDNYRLIASSRRVVIDDDVSEEIIVKSNRETLEKVLSNIISNAINYSDGLVKIYYDNHFLCIENTCLSYSEEEINNLFKPFYRPDYARNRNDGGSGLGLYFTKRFLDILNLPFEFKPCDNGMCFRIRIDQVKIIE